LIPKTGKTVPVSTDNPDKSQEQPNVGEIEVKGDNIVWNNQNISPDQVEKLADTNPEFLSALKSHPEMYAKYQAKTKGKIDKPKGKKPPVSEQLNYINPFQRGNFLY
jgi:hypothetical protein